ncbi:MAG: oligosaccharide flippase family protein [Ignavibacteriae bacterium]|nr:oligosaccharide flippase family protein [Ignavibacteriota bacterium]
MFDVFKKTLKSSLLYGAGTVSSKLIGFILIPLYTSYLTIADFGILSLVEITTTLITAIISLKINAAFFRWYYDKEYLSRQKSLFFTSIFLLLVFNALLFFIFYFYSEHLSLIIFDTKDYSYLFILMYISASLQVTIDLVLYLIRLQDNALYYSTVSVLKLLVALILIIVFVTTLGRKVEGIYEATIISQIFFILITLKYILRNSEFKLEFLVFFDMMKFSIPLIFAELSGIILTISDRYCLNFLSTVSEVGVYSLGYKISNTIRVIIYSSIMLAVGPMIYKYINLPNNKRFYSKLLTYFAFAVMILTLFISIFTENIVQLLAEDKSYWTAAELIPILSFAILFGILKDISLTGLNITKKSKIIAMFIFIMAVLNILLNFLLIPYFAANGAAYATLISSIISFSMFYVVAQKHYFIPYEILKVTMTIWVGAVLAVFSYFVRIENIYFSLIFKSTLFFSFPIILYYLNFYEEVELMRIKQGWHKWKNPFDWKNNFKKIKP